MKKGHRWFNWLALGAYGDNYPVPIPGYFGKVTRGLFGVDCLLDECTGVSTLGDTAKNCREFQGGYLRVFLSCSRASVPRGSARWSLGQPWSSDMLEGSWHAPRIGVIVPGGHWFSHGHVICLRAPRIVVLVEVAGGHWASFGLILCLWGVAYPPAQWSSGKGKVVF